MGDGADRTTYEIGVAMAGAASAGAYSAGVVDFLIEALEKWYRAKEERPDEVPTHDVCLKVVSGSSAGGMTGAIAAGIFSGHHAPITSLPGKGPDASTRQSNPLYTAWVEQVDIHPLLGHADLYGADDQVVSLLDSSILNEIAETAVDFEPRDAPRDYVADPLHLLLTATNLRGVPYNVAFEGAQKGPHRMTRHTDYKEFTLGRAAPDGESARWLDPSDPGAEGWDVLRQYALATGAFPGGLAPRVLTRPRDDYLDRRWTVPLPGGEGHGQYRERRSIDPAWPDGRRDKDEYRFLAVDGGATNNEPFGLARQKLAGGEELSSRPPSETTRSVLMVDPLPSDPVAGKGEPQDRSIPSVLAALFDSLIAQARFKPDELIRARSSTDHSRYVIVPTRRDQNGEKVPHPIASEMLGGFGGFLKKKFRMHDFQQGRRNCQQFLRRHFGLPRDECADNPVFSHYSAEELDDLAVDRNGDAIVPIIPLVEDVEPEEFPLDWDVLGMSDWELERLETRIEDRTKRVMNSLVDQHAGGWWKPGFFKFLGNVFARDPIVKNIMSRIEASLDEYGLRK